MQKCSSLRTKPAVKGCMNMASARANPWAEQQYVQRVAFLMETYTGELCIDAPLEAVLACPGLRVPEVFI